MLELDDDLNNQFNLLRASYSSKLPEKFKQLSDIENELTLNGLSLNTLKELYQLVHSLSGSCAMFGFQSLSDIADELERFLKPVINSEDIGTDDQHKTIINSIERLRQAFKELN